MTAIIYSSSLAAAFLGGTLALFAPCCVVSLLPNFVAAAIQRGLRNLPVTALLFSAGLATILLPIVLGVGAVGQLLSSYHGPVFFAVGTFLLLLGLYMLSGRSLMLPIPALSLQGSRGSASGVYLLGLVSGVASSCCAPVVMGVVAMSALAGSTIGGLALGLAYVFGMVFPLFWAAILWERFRLADRTRLLRRLPSLHVGGRRVSWNDAVAGSMFVLVGAVSLALAVTGQASLTPGPLATWNRWITGRVADLASALTALPIWIQGAVVGLLACATVMGLYRSWRVRRRAQSDLVTRDTYAPTGPVGTSTTRQ